MATRQLPLHIRVLQAELEKRKSRNSRYSMRAFAKYLEMDASALSRVLSGKLDLSLQACSVILKKLEMSTSEIRLFIAAVSEDKRNRAAAILTRAIDPVLINDTEFDPRFESIVRPNEKLGLTGRDVLALSSDIISMMDLDGRFLHANTTTAKRLKSIPCELVGERWENTEVGAEAAALFEAQQAEVIKADKEMMFEFTLGKDDDLRYYTRQITPIRRNDGSMLAYASTIRDVTAERLLWIANDQMFSAKNLEELLNIVARAGTPTVSPSCILQIGENVKTAEFKSAHHRQETSDSDYLKFLVSGPLKTVIENASLHASKSTVVNLDVASSKELGYKTNPAPSTLLIAPIETSTGESGRLIFLRDGEFPPGATLFAERIAKSASNAISNSRALAI